MHLGRRSVKTDGLHIKERYGCSNIDWFRQTYPEDTWINFCFCINEDSQKSGKGKNES